MKRNQQMGLIDAVRLLVATQGAVQFDFTPNRSGTPHPPRSFQHKRPPKRRGRRQCAQVKR